MPTFNTPQPITAAIELVVGDARITATDRADTIVEVRPSDGSQESDVRAAEQTRVEYSAGRLLVKAPKQRNLSLFGKPGSIDVTIEVPTGSSLEGDAAIAAFRSTGRLGDCRVKTATGDINLDQTGTLHLHTSVGTIVVDHVSGDAEVGTSSGKVRVGRIEGNALIKSSNGHCSIGEVGGSLRVNTANGDICVERASADVTAATAKGDVRVADIIRGVVSLKTALGQIEIGIHPGSAARLDVHTSFGRVHNLMDAADKPEASDQTVDVRAHTSCGDIVIRRS
jgi:DUF4097 and DUF4098 domain-containing protein YvlB